MVKLNEGGKYLKTAEVNTGEFLEFLSEGEWIENTRYKYPDGNPRVDFIVKIKHNEEEKSFRVNKTNRDILIQAWGVETQDWVGKKAKIEIETVLAGGKRMKTILLHPENLKQNPVDGPAWDD